MYTLAYDESSGFEAFDRNPRVVTIIAGFIYNDGGKKLNECSETSVEETRVMNYLKRLCADSNADFPSSLHAGFNDNTALCTNIQKSLCEFMRKGTYKGQELLYLSQNGHVHTTQEDGCSPLPRKGKYQLHVIYLTKDGVTDPSVIRVAFKDDEASNNYINMVEALIRDAIFINPSISDKKPEVAFKIPTRVYPIESVRDRDQRAAYTRLYETIPHDNPEYYLVIGRKHQHMFAKIIDGLSDKSKRAITLRGDLYPISIRDGYVADAPDDSFSFMFLADIITWFLKKDIYRYTLACSRQKTKKILSAYRNSKCDFGEDQEAIEACIQRIESLLPIFGIMKEDLIISRKKVTGIEAKKWLKKQHRVFSQTDTDIKKKWFSEKEPQLQDIVSELEEMIQSKEENETGEHSLKESLKKVKTALQKQYVPDHAVIQLTGVRHFKERLAEIIVTLKHLGDMPDGAFLEEIYARMQMLSNGRNGSLYCYDDIDYCYYRASCALNEKDLFAFYSNLYDGVEAYGRRGQRPNKTIQKHYRDTLFKALEQKAREKAGKEPIKKAIDNLIRYRFSDNRNPGKLMFVFKKVYDLYMESVQKREQIGNLYLFRLYDVGMSAYTHVGNTKEALAFYQKCMEITSGVGTEERLFTTNRAITIYNDLLDYEKAETIGCGLLKIKSAASFASLFRKRINAILNKPFNVKLREDITEPSIYKTASSLGQTYAFMGKNDWAEAFFKEVIEHKENDADLNITISYCLHLYIESRQKQKYEELAARYFGNHTKLEDQLDYLIEQGMKPSGEAPFSMSYALFVFVKAFYVFYKDSSENAVILNQLVDLDETLKAKLEMNNKKLEPEMMKGHPWEIIYKYSALMEEYTPNKGIKNIKKANGAVSRRSRGNIIDLVVKYGELEYKEDRVAHGHKNGKSLEHLEKRVNEIWSLVKNNPNICKDWTEKDGDYEFRRRQLKQMFVYMYH